jgi:hypothetical protein
MRRDRQVLLKNEDFSDWIIIAFLACLVSMFLFQKPARHELSMIRVGKTDGRSGLKTMRQASSAVRLLSAAPPH